MSDEVRRGDGRHLDIQLSLERAVDRSSHVFRASRAVRIIVHVESAPEKKKGRMAAPMAVTFANVFRQAAG